MSPPPYSTPNTPELAGARRGLSITTNGRPSTAFVLAFFGSLLLVSAILCCVVYVWRKRALAAADLEASRLAQETAVAKRQEELEYQELGEKLLGQTGLSFKPLVLDTTNSKVHKAVYKSLALPLFVRNKKGNDGTVIQVTKMNERPQWMPRPQWIKRSAMSYKRASTSNITFSLCHRHQEVAATAFKSSASCPGGFQKHQFKSKNTSTCMPSDTPSQPSTTVTDKELTFGGVVDVATVNCDGKDHADDVVSDKNGVKSASELSDESFSSIECVLGSSSTTSKTGVGKVQRSALDNIADDLLSDSLSQAREGELYTHPASGLFEDAHNERLNVWFEKVRNAQCKGGEDLMASRTSPQLHSLLKAISFRAKTSPMGTAKPSSLTLHTLPLSKRPSRVISRSRRGCPRPSPVSRLHLTVAVSFSNSRDTSPIPFGMRGVRRSSNIILCSLGTANRTRRPICTLNASGAPSPLIALNISELDDTDLFPLFKPRPMRIPFNPSPATKKSGRAPLGAISNNTDVPHRIRPLASPLLLINGVVADEIFATKQVGGLGNPTLDLPPQDNNLLNLTWVPKSSLRPITLKVTVKRLKSGSDIGTGRAAGRARSGSFFSRGRARHNQNRSEGEDAHADGVLHILDVTTYAESSFQDFREGVESALGYHAYFRGRVDVQGKEMYLPLLAEKHFRHWLDDRLAEGVAVAHIDAWRRDY